MIMVIKPTALAMENTIARLATCSSSAIGAASTLHAYMEPMQRLIRQLTASIRHLFVVSIFLSSFEIAIKPPPEV